MCSVIVEILYPLDPIFSDCHYVNIDLPFTISRYKLLFGHVPVCPVLYVPVVLWWPAYFCECTYRYLHMS